MVHISIFSNQIIFKDFIGLNKIFFGLCMQMIPGVEAILPVSLFDNHVCIEKVYRLGSYYTRS